MQVNNFDCSSKGVNIEVNVYHADIDAQYRFDENFEELCSDVYQYIDYGNIELLSNDELFTINPKKVTKKDVIDALEYLRGYCDDSMLKDDLIDELYGMDFCDLYSPTWSRNKSIHDLLDVTLKFEVIRSSGYSQGDVRDVIIPHKLVDVWGCKKSNMMNGMQDEIDNLLWNVPINGEIVVDGSEYFISEYMDDSYEWDADAVLESFKSTHDDLDDVVFEELSELLPSEIEY